MTADSEVVSVKSCKFFTSQFQKKNFLFKADDPANFSRFEVNWDIVLLLFSKKTYRKIKRVHKSFLRRFESLRQPKNSGILFKKIKFMVILVPCAGRIVRGVQGCVVRILDLGFNNGLDSGLWRQTGWRVQRLLPHLGHFPHQPQLHTPHDYVRPPYDLCK